MTNQKCPIMAAFGNCLRSSCSSSKTVHTQSGSTNYLWDMLGKWLVEVNLNFTWSSFQMKNCFYDMCVWSYFHSLSSSLADNSHPSNTKILWQHLLIFTIMLIPIVHWCRSILRYCSLQSFYNAKPCKKTVLYHLKQTFEFFRNSSWAGNLGKLA